LDNQEYKVFFCLLICIVHLKKNSLHVKEGQTVVCGQTLASCGNSGNSIQPHIHIQAMDSLDFQNTKGVPLYFENYIESDMKGNSKIIRNKAFPNKNRIISSIASNINT
jgi:murein DD-endopeptidase MepM/ murein hydrolase activator NlpD